MPNSAILKASSRSETLIRFIDTTSYHVVELWHWERGMNPPLSAWKLEYDESHNRYQSTNFQCKLCKCSNHFAQLFNFHFQVVHWLVLLSFRLLVYYLGFAYYSSHL